MPVEYILIVLLRLLPLVLVSLRFGRVVRFVVASRPVSALDFLPAWVSTYCNY